MGVQTGESFEERVFLRSPGKVSDKSVEFIRCQWFSHFALTEAPRNAFQIPGGIFTLLWAERFAYTPF